MVSIKTATYKESTGKSTIDFIFATPQLLNNLILYKVVEDFGHNLNHQPILFKWTSQMADKPTDSQCLLAKIDNISQIETLQKILARALCILE